MDRQERLEALITPSLEAMGYELVRVMVQGKQRPTLQVMAERVDRVPMTVDDCADISRTLSALLDVEDPIEGSYLLEVSSPGLDRPLTRPQDYERFAGYEAKVETNRPVEGRKRFKGRILGIADGVVTVAAEEVGELKLAWADIHRAKLVLTDELIQMALKEQHSH